LSQTSAFQPKSLPDVLPQQTFDGAGDEDLDQDEEEQDDEIVVSGKRLRGAVVTDIPPEVQLRSRAIRALGAGSAEEVLEQIAPQVRGRSDGEPVVLLNGRRVSSFNEIRDLPPEAIHRVDVFPEEVALQYGFPAQSARCELRLASAI
jgi:hypothetical protein